MRVPAILAVVVAVLGATPSAAAGDGWVWPVEGRVLTLYSNDNARPYAGGMHRGIDIAAGVGTTVVAARGGTVTHAGVVGSSGLTVAVRTADGQHVTSYLHLSAAAVKKGDVVPAGARIGATGTSGRPSVAEPHLHFGVRLAATQDHYVDPLSLLPPLPAPGAAPASPVPVAAPLRAESQPVPVAAPAPAAPRARAAPRRAPAPLRPRGALHPGPVIVPAPVVPGPVPARPVAEPVRVPAGPAPLQSPAAARARVAAARPIAEPAQLTGHGRGLVLGGLAAIALVLFGGAALRAVVRANSGVNGAAVAAVARIRDRIRIPPRLRRLLSP